jgi:hypothetical protein
MGTRLRTICEACKTSLHLGALLATLLLIVPCTVSQAEAQSCGQGWCNTFPVTGVVPDHVTPPFGSSAWNKLNYVPDAGRFFIFSSDGIYTFSNSWWSYGVLGHVATNNPWIEESTSGTVGRTVTDNSKGFLKAAIGSTDESLTLRNGEGASFHPDPIHGGILVVDDEEIGYTAGDLSGDTFKGIRRGVRGTTLVSHAAGAMVNGGAPFPQSRIKGKLIAVNDHVPDRHPFLTSAYDSTRHQLFQAGGIIENNKKVDTWYFCLVENQFCPTQDVRVWKWLHTKTPVPPRADAAMTYDSDDDVMLWYGGQTGGSPRAETWLLCFKGDPQANGNKIGCPSDRAYPDWVKITTNGSPSPRYAHSIVYDTFHHVALLFGGIDGQGRDPSDTWLYAPGTSTWKNAKPSGSNPGAFRRPAMTYDATRHRIVLYEGPPEKISDGVQGGLFLYDATTNRWELSSVAGGPVPGYPPPHGRLSLDYDPQTDTFVATELALPYALQVWELKGSALSPSETPQPFAHK